MNLLVFYIMSLVIFLLVSFFFCMNKIPWPKQLAYEEAHFSLKSWVKVCHCGEVTVGTSNSHIKSRGKWVISCRGSAKFFYSYTVENLIPRVWCHPQWTSFPTSIYSQQSSTDSLPSQPNLGKPSMRLFLGDSRLCQIYVSHHYNYLIFLFVHLCDFLWL